MNKQATTIPCVHVPYPPEKKPPFFISRHDLDWGGGLFLNMHFPSNISPPWPVVWKDDTIVGRVPREISRVCCFFFLQKSSSEMTCQVDGNRRRSAMGKGLVIPCVYVFRGKQKHLDRLISVFAKLEVSS